MSKTLLMIDDSESDHFLTKHTIKAFDANIKQYHVHSGQGALDFIASNTDIDVILLDINMPEMDGFEFLAAYLQQPHKNSRVYLMLGAAMTAEHTEKAAKYPCLQGFVSKPVKRDDLDKIFSEIENETK